MDRLQALALDASSLVARAPRCDQSCCRSQPRMLPFRMVGPRMCIALAAVPFPAGQPRVLHSSSSALPSAISACRVIQSCPRTSHEPRRLTTGTRRRNRQYRLAPDSAPRTPVLPINARFPNATEEPVLPQVARPAPARVVVLRVPAMHSAQQQAQRIFATRQQNQVHMIAHQTPRPQPNLSFELQLRQDSPEEDASRYGDLRRRKRSPPIHSALNSHDREFPVAHNALVLASPRILHERKKIGQIRLSPFSVPLFGRGGKTD